MRHLFPLSCLLFALTACDKGGPEDLDEDGFSAEEDCDDDNPEIFPGADEICDGVDNNCDGEADEGVLITFFDDADGDGFGAQDQSTDACEASGSLVESDKDCDDTNADINPSADEVCDGVDNDCSGVIDGPDSTDALSFYLDSDEDGFGDPAVAILECEVPAGYSALDTDCDDTNASVYPGAEEICDGLDTDCDSTIGEQLYPSDYSDLQVAIDSGQTEICIEAGTHSVNLDLNAVDTLTLTGAGGSDAVFLDGGGARVIDMGNGASNIVLSGLTLQNANEAGKDGLGIRANTCSNVTLNDIVVKDIVGDSAGETGMAIGFTQCTDVTIQDTVVHSVTATHSSTSGNDSFGLVGYNYGDGLVVDGLEIYDSQVSGFSSVFGSAFGFRGDASSASLSLNDLYVHGVTETGTTDLSYGMVLAWLATDVDIANVNIQENDQDGAYVTSAFFVYQTQGDVDVHNVQVIGNTTATSELTYAPQFWEFASTGAVSISNILSAGNTSTAAQTTYGVSVWFANASATSYEVSQVTVFGNTSTNTSTQGGGALACSGEVSLSNSTVSGNRADGGSSLAGIGAPADVVDCVLTASYNNVYDNGVNFGTVPDFTGTNGNIALEPSFADVSSTDPSDWDLTLASGSALIDAGDPAVLDADGSTSDIGAYGGPLGESWE